MIDREEIHKELEGIFSRNNRKSLITRISILYYGTAFWSVRRIEGLRPIAFNSFLHYYLYPTPWGLNGSELYLIGAMLSDGDGEDMIMLKEMYRAAPDVFEDMNGAAPYHLKYRQLVESLYYHRGGTFTLKPIDHE